MKALSLWQPHAAAIALELKTYETRGWSTSYRGPLAIHAAKRAWDDLDEWHGEAAQKLLRRSADLIGASYPFIDFLHKKRAAAYLRDRVLVFGAVVCTVDLVDCIPTRELRGRIDPAVEFWGDFSDGEDGAGRFAFKLENLRLLDVPLEARGMQGFFEVDLGAKIEPPAIPAPVAAAGEQLDLFGGAF
jgi:hypothetical protein